ncbi:RraA-like protein [Endogone sp. FLAS-F59071]|nr:RraA-like protein [Endogone sp. FLAS-F59071]|eukprot:RUS22328.1 RraA-like protein [Endogone sp. FLAS-F59071]
MPAPADLLNDFSSCDVADALGRLGHDAPYSGYLPDIVMYSPEYCRGSTKIVGEAFTVKVFPESKSGQRCADELLIINGVFPKMVDKSDTTSPKPVQHFVDAAPSDCIMVISAPPNVKNAVWGGLMAAGAKTRGVRGVVVDGRVRDLAEQREDGFPVFARAPSILGAGAFTRPSLLATPVTIHRGDGHPPLTVRPGDIIVADLDGVVCVPVERVAEVAEECRKGVETDGRCMEAIRAGAGVQETFKKFRG